MSMSIKLVKGMLIATALGVAAQASAMDLGYKATIYDGNGPVGEDNEVEPGMLNQQNWDMEGFYYNDTTDVLSMIGGFDVVNGEIDPATGDVVTAGDIFLSTGTPVYGDIHGQSGPQVVKNTFGYDYVVDVDYAAGTWELLSLDSTADVLTAFMGTNQGSNPFQYVGNGTATGINGSFSLTTATDAEVGYTGGTHYVMSIDLSDLAAQTTQDTVFYSHFTMGCGNDNLMGSYMVPEPTTLALFSIGIAGLWFSRRKQNSSNTLSA
jgi:hypothetical protein